MQVVLVQCPLWGTFDPPIGLAQLSSYLKKQGHQVRSFDLNIKLYLNQSEDRRGVWAWEESDFWYHPEHVKKFFSDNSKIIAHYVEQMLGCNASVVGFSVNMASRLSSLEFARRLKERNKELNIVFGGPLFLQESLIGDVLKEGCVDIVIPGEGLLAFSDLISTFKLVGEMSSCKGLVYKRNGAIVNTGRTSLVDLDSLPFLDLTDLPLKDYDNGTHISLMTSRGCTRRCIFCSDAPCWPGYRVMSGRRIFEEVKFHKNKYRRSPQADFLGHVDFVDLAFNGDMDSLIEFSDLMIEANLDVVWTANMYIRPEMTLEVIKKMKVAGCEHIIIGIESGSERVLSSMNKHYNMSDADRIIREMYETGICVTANFMFGFPGETEDDFGLTLDFLRRNARYMGVYPSRTYCALEKFSYLEKHREKFSIKPDPPNHIFWESIDGTNTYPVRMERCRRFCELALKLGVEITAGVQTAVSLDEWFNLGCYYESKGDYPKAITNFLKYAYEDPTNAIIKDKLLSYQKRLQDIDLDEGIKNDFEKVIDIIVSARPSSKKTHRDRPLSSAFVKLEIDKLDYEIERFKKTMEDYSGLPVLIEWIHKNKNHYKMLSKQQQDNLSGKFDQLALKVKNLPLSQMNQNANEEEFKEKKIWMYSLPMKVYLPLAGNSSDFHYIFEPQSEIRNGLSLGQFNKEYVGTNLDLFLSWAKRCIFKGAGDFSLDREGGEILDSFEKSYPHLEKEVFTNGVKFSKEVIDRIASYSSDYIINFGLHASHRDLHRKISNKDNFDEIMASLEFLSKIRKRSNNIVLHIICTVTALNIVDLPNIISLAAGSGVDKVIVDYNCIYTDKDKDISCFFRQDLTNKIFDIVKRQAKGLNLYVQLPPKFKQDFYPSPVVCRNPWSQLVLSSDGKIFPCEHFQIWNTEFNGKVPFQQIWNSMEYITVRGCFSGACYSECSMFCYYVDPRQVNSLRSHIFNAKYFGFKSNQKFQKDLFLNLDGQEIEKIIDLVECFLRHRDFVSSERIIEDIFEKVKYPSRIFRLLAGLHREEAEYVNSASEKKRLLELAQKEIEKSLVEWPYDAWTFAEAARIYSVLGNHKQAMEAIRKAVSLAPEEEKFKLLEQELTVS